MRYINLKLLGGNKEIKITKQLSLKKESY